MDFAAILARVPNWFFWAVGLCILFNFWAIAHVFYRKFPTDQEKMIWICVVTFVPALGPLIYLFVGFKRGIKPR